VLAVGAVVIAAGVVGAEVLSTDDGDAVTAGTGALVAVVVVELPQLARLIRATQTKS
jgi:hypothetical protein